MMASRGFVLSSLSVIQKSILGSSLSWNASPSPPGGLLSQVRQYAARKGTREKARKKKVKKEVKKLTLADKIQRSKKVTIVKPSALLYVDAQLPVATDDVYCQKFFQMKIYPFEEAIQCHREALHPTVLNAPDSTVKLFAELNFEGVKKTKPVETFNKIVPMIHKFDHGEERKILVFCKTEEQVAEALAEGATLAGGTDIVKLIMNGELSLQNYDTVLAHPSMMPEILTIRGLLKRKHPNLKAGTLSPDIKTMVYTFLHGIRYTAKAFDQFPTYGEATIPIGRLNMEIKQLEENMQSVIDSLMSAKPKRPGPFITRLRIICPPSRELFKIDHKLYTKEEEDAPTTTSKDDENEEDEDDSAVAVTV